MASSMSPDVETIGKRRMYLDYTRRAVNLIRFISRQYDCSNSRRYRQLQ